MGKHDREKEQDGQVPADKPLPKGDWVRKDDGGRSSGRRSGRHSSGKQDAGKE
jgi:hypothetical protein